MSTRYPWNVSVPRRSGPLTPLVKTWAFTVVPASAYSFTIRSPAGTPGRRPPYRRRVRTPAANRTARLYSIAMIHAGLGDREAAFRWLQQSFDRHETSLPYMKLDPRLDSLRLDRRFAALLGKLNL